MKNLGRRTVWLGAGLFASWDVYKDVRHGTYWVRWFDDYLEVKQAEQNESSKTGWRLK